MNRVPFPAFRPLQFLLVIAWALLISGCKKDHLFDCFKGTGDEHTEVRNLSGFDKVFAENNVDVDIYPGHEFKIEVTAGDKLIESITTEVTDSTLYIRNENKCNWVRSFKNKFKVKVWMPSLAVLNSYGSGNITLKDTIVTNEFEYNNWNASGEINLLFNTNSAHLNIHTGPGNVSLYGHVGIHYLYHNGQGLIDARQCQTDITFTNNMGTNNIIINVTNDLYAKISYIGNIYYYGNPTKFYPEVLGSGKIIKAD